MMTPSTSVMLKTAMGKQLYRSRVARSAVVPERSLRSSGSPSAKARDDFGRQIDVMTYGLVACRETEKDVVPGRNIRSDRTTRSSAIRPSAGRCSVRAQVRADPVRMGDGFRHGDQSCGSSNRKPTLSPT